ncbi:thiol peroxidase (atypical 2-Cys peroxiredoxin) [Providencia alcalifaciens]|uniref:Thiol peroxidase n=1 Tax=Providencia alcalifaciens TaxID=126385 RepID=A0A4R3NED5_9GAMM|nr:MULTISPECIES: thiol peroxidase [Providencia]MBC5792253.1 thiol peroxidase [Providencia sp. JUb39]TCT28142.1 thiol peroxidase (atypical 2-Cys peroxiredoxin) [Providencia alcalifaciens]
MLQTVQFYGNDVVLNGVFLQSGDKAKPFVLVDNALNEVTLETYKGRRKVLNIFPSIDTPVCAASVRQFNQVASEVVNTVVLCISADLPFAQSRYCGSEELENVVTLSTFRNTTFANDYGVEIRNGILTGLMARAVIVIDENNRVLYSQRVSEITNEPDYVKALSYLKSSD